MWLVLYNYSALFWHNIPTLPKNLLITWTPSTLLIALVSSFGNSSSSVWQNRFSTNFSMTWTKSFERQRESISILVFSFSLFSFDKNIFNSKLFSLLLDRFRKNVCKAKSIILQLVSFLWFQAVWPDWAIFASSRQQLCFINLVNFWAYFEKHHYLSKKCFSHFWGNIWNNC